MRYRKWVRGWLRIWFHYRVVNTQIGRRRGVMGRIVQKINPIDFELHSLRGNQIKYYVHQIKFIKRVENWVKVIPEVCSLVWSMGCLTGTERTDWLT